MSRELYYSHAIREALWEEMQRDERVFLIGEDIARYGGAFKVNEGFLEEFGPERVINTPIAENSYVGVAVGAALTGMRPVTEMMFMDFIALAMDQLVNHAAKFHYMYGGQAKVPLVVRCPAGAGRGYGPSHSQSLERWFVGIPGFKVVAPSTAHDAKGLLKSAIRDDNPVIFLENKLLYGRRGPVREQEYAEPLGQAKVLREGDDVTIVAYSRMVEESLKAADALIGHAISAEVVDLRTLIPLDAQTLTASVQKTGRAVLVEEGHLTGGVMAEVGMRIMESCFDYLQAPLKRLGAWDTPVPCSIALDKAMHPDWEAIGRAAAEAVHR